ncbi:MAG: 23S rRNA (guanosine(2251)-2'-O)-methyltransferase RlmB [Clostridiales bacterium]|nr:23S rRNA (guanosine(2251)-2'-O)-methyltransferase RlmB [Clostridiales bacterium]
MRIFGKNTCLEILNSNKKINKVYLQKNVEENFKNKVLQKCKNTIFVDKDFLNKLTNFKVHQGVVMEIEDFKYCSLDDILNIHKENNTKAFILVLDGVVDPQNLGSLIRTAVCGGVDGIIISKNRSASVNDTVYKISVGAINYIKICEVTNINDTIKRLKKENIWVYGLEAGEKTIYETDLTYHTALVVGSEGNGISKLTKSLCDEIVSLPLKNKINSLNASVAGAVAIYEVVRQRHSRVV